MTRLPHLAFSLGCLGLLGGCAGVPSGTQPVEGFELERYYGEWHEIARLPNSFEEGLSCVSADYSPREDGGVRVINRGYNAEQGEWSQAEGRAYFTRGSETAALKVSFFGPFYGGYNVLALDEDYQWSLVAGADRDYLWILAREPQLDDVTYQALVDQAAELGFATDALIKVEQGDACPSPDNTDS
ncbi:MULTISPECIES: lipocalin family protein [Cobetia]|uniref:lipocalin family protein n=1 Tax=Cobetia TaxID=204286 RepID=UPI001581A0B3|nr:MULTISPECIES: lipocalin family protein [Cobetia]MDI4659614.1 lipocalin family protein [Cobetia sp. BMC6]MDL2192419.1 lipocalin family protein [Cobetia sp. LC6]NUJ56164.1 lipocalin family protein [Cobetia marina]